MDALQEGVAFMALAKNREIKIDGIFIEKITYFGLNGVGKISKICTLCIKKYRRINLAVTLAAASYLTLVPLIFWSNFVLMCLLLMMPGFLILIWGLVCLHAYLLSDETIADSITCKLAMKKLPKKLRNPEMVEFFTRIRAGENKDKITRSDLV